MTLAIIILSYLWWLSDFLEMLINDKQKTNLLFNGALVTLVSWQASTPWGIVMCVVTSLALIVAFVKQRQ